MNPCCAPTKVRAAVLIRSQTLSAERQSITTGSTTDMLRLDGGRFLMGSEDADGISADGEGPVRSVILDPFYLDRHPVTNADFAEFVAATGYRTEAETFAWSFVFEGHLPRPEGDHPIGLHWWRKVDGADWRHPEGPDATIAGRENYPVVHLSWNDA